MTLVAYEKSRSFDQGTDGQSGTRTFLVVEDDSTVTTQPSINQVLRTTGVRLYTQDNPTGGDPPPLGNLIPLSVTVRSETDALIQYTVDYKYGPETLTGATPAPGDPEFVTFTQSTRPVAIDIWRTDEDLNQNSDVEGIPVDEAGLPLTSFIRQTDLEINVRYENYNDIPSFQSLVGRRNSTTYMGVSPGYILFTGMTVARDGVNSYRATYTFTYDELKHMRQVPARDQNGTVITSDRFTIDDRQHADIVVYKQPFPRTTNFGLLGIPVP